VTSFKLANASVVGSKLSPCTPRRLEYEDGLGEPPFDLCYLVFCYPKYDFWVLDKLVEHLQGQDRYPTPFEHWIISRKGRRSFVSVCIG